MNIAIEKVKILDSRDESKNEKILNLISILNFIYLTVQFRAKMSQ